MYQQINNNTKPPCAALFLNHNQSKTASFLTFDDVKERTTSPDKTEKNRSPCIAPQLSGYKVKDEVTSLDAMSMNWIDIDDGDLSKDQLLARLSGAGIESYAVYSTASAMRLNTKTGETNGHRWRVVIEAGVQPVAQWVKIQEALADLLGGDSSANRPTQILYAPTIPPGESDYYDYSIGSGSPLDPGNLPSAIQASIDKRAKAEQEEHARKDEITQARLRQRMPPTTSKGFSFTDASSALPGISQLLENYGYQRIGGKYTSPHSTSGVPGVVVFDDARWFSHHASDTGKGIGLPVENGCCGDAFDLYCHFEHGGNVSAALKGLANKVDPVGQKERQREYMKAQEVEQTINLSKGDFLPYSVTDKFMDDLAKIPPRDWLSEKHLLRGYPSVLVSTGGVGKSTVELSRGVSIATGRDILGLGVSEQCSVLIINNEDDLSEIQRRLAAIMIFHNITPDEIQGRLFIQSGYGSPLIVARQLKDGTVIVSPQVDKIKAFVLENNIGLISVDPFISTHTVGENDNTGIDQVLTVYKGMAKDTHCAISLVHHTRKQGNDSEVHAGDAESGRGASSMKDAARCVDTLARMSLQTANKIGMTPDERVRHIRLDTGKLNYQLLDSGAKWFRMESVFLPNGDSVGVPRPVNLAPSFEQATAEDGRTKWTPTLVAEALHRVMRGSEITFNEIIGLFMEDNDIQERQAKRCASIISNDPKKGTRIKVGGELFEYWYSKSHKTAPIVIHRECL